MKPIYVKLAAIALLALMALAPIISLTRGVQYPAGEWRVAFLTQGNKPVPKGIGTVFLYNTTNGVANKVELS